MAIQPRNRWRAECRCCWVDRTRIAHSIATTIWSEELMKKYAYVKILLAIMTRANDKIVFLPPANEVWGKVIFSEACVKNSVYGGVPGQGVPGPGGAWSVGCLVSGGCVEIPPTTTAVGGTHPTGMHSCFQLCFLKLNVYHLLSCHRFYL